jgi:hypothetical protein
MDQLIYMSICGGQFKTLIAKFYIDEINYHKDFFRSLAGSTLGITRLGTMQKNEALYLKKKKKTLKNYSTYGFCYKITN